MSVLNSFIGTVGSLRAGGTIEGDLTIDGDLTVSGSSAITTNEVIQGTSIIDVTNTEAFLIRKDSDGGDVFVVDSTNGNVGINGASVTTWGKNLTLKHSTANQAAGLTLYNTAAAMTDGNIVGVVEAVAAGNRIANISFYVDGTDENSGTIALKTGNEGNPAEAMRITKEGNVGIGATPAGSSTPSLGASKLEVHGGTYNTSLLIKGAAGNSGITFVDSGGTVDGYVYASGDTIGFLDSGGSFMVQCENDAAITFSIADSNKMKLDTNSRISLSNNDSGGTGGADSTSGNTLFGYLAGEDIVSGVLENTLVGHGTGKEVGSGAWNTMVGAKCGDAITNGYGNVFIGHNAYSRSDLGNYNTVIGINAMSGTATSANYTGIVAIGKDALLGATNTTIAVNNTVAIGTKALEALISGEKNTAIGYSAGAAMTTSDRNVIIGYNAYLLGNNADNNGENVIIGAEACDGAAHADIKQSVYIGYNIAPALGNHGAQKNTGIGRSCFGNLTTGSETIAIGRAAGATFSTGNSSIYIGNDNVGSAAGTREIVLGSGITGSGDHTTTIGSGGVFKFVSKSVTCDLGGDLENDPAHATAIGKIPRYAVITRATAVVTILSSDSNHTLKLILSSDSSGTDNDALSDPQELIGAGVTESWAGTVTNGASTDINVASGATIKAAYATVAVGTDTGLSSLDTSTADTYVYLAFADGSYGGGDGQPSTAPVVSVMVEYAGLD